MARKRAGLAPGDAERLFGHKLSVLLGERPRASNPTLDLLTGGPPQEHAHVDQDENTSRGSVRARRTVYLSAEELEAVDALVRELSNRAQRRISRSELVRQALRLLHQNGIEPLAQEEANHAGDG